MSTLNQTSNVSYVQESWNFTEKNSTFINIQVLCYHQVLNKEEVNNDVIY